MSKHTTHYLTVEGGTLAYQLSGIDGPLVVLAHGMGDSRQAYRFLTPALVNAGYRVAAVDLRGHGESSPTWDGYTRTDLAGDLIGLIRHLGGPAVLVGHSIAGGAVTIAAAQAPQLVTAVVEVAPFTRAQKISLSDFTSASYRRGSTALMSFVVLGGAKRWAKYLDLAYPGIKPADYTTRQDQISAMLSEPGRAKVVQAMGKISPADAGEQLPNLTCPVLVIQGSDDPDWANPRAEGEAIVADLPAGLGQLSMIEGAGHYPHVQYPDETLAAMLPFLKTATATARKGEAGQHA